MTHRLLLHLLRPHKNPNKNPIGEPPDRENLKERMLLRRREFSSRASVTYVVVPQLDELEERTRIRINGVAVVSAKTTKERTIAMDLAGWVVIGQCVTTVETTADRCEMTVVQFVEVIGLHCVMVNAEVACVGMVATVRTLEATVIVVTIAEVYAVTIVVATRGAVQHPAETKVPAGETYPDRSQPSRRTTVARSGRRKPATLVRMRTVGPT